MPRKHTLVVAALLGLAVPALGKSFTLAPASPSGNTYTIYHDGAGGPHVGVGMISFGLGPGDKIDAISAGDDPVRGSVNGPRRFHFSVRRPSEGAAGSGVAAEYPDQMGDIFIREWDSTGTNELAPAPNGWSGMDGEEVNAGLVLTGLGDNVNGLEFSDLLDDGGVNPPGLEREIYFSLAAGSPALAFYGWSAADILAIGGFYGGAPVRVLTAADIGLPAEADVDALALEMQFDPVEDVPVIRAVAYSITSASTPLNLAGSGHEIISGAALIGSRGRGNARRMRPFFRMGLLEEDDINALEMEATAGATENGFGLDHTALGSAQVSASPGAPVDVMNIGSNGNDGVRIALGAAEYAGLTIANLDQWSSESGVAATLVGFDDDGGQTGEELTELGRLEMVNSVLLPGWQGWLLQPSDPVPGPLRLYSEGQMVAEIPIEPDQTPTVLFQPPQGAVRFFHGEGVLASLGVGTLSTTTFEVPGYGSFQADYASFDENNGGWIATHAAIEAHDVGSFQIIDESLQMFGNAHRALGQATMLGANDIAILMLNLTNIGSTGLDGVTADTTPADAIEVAVEFDDPSADFGMSCGVLDFLEVLANLHVQGAPQGQDIGVDFPTHQGMPMSIELRLAGETVQVLEDLDQTTTVNILSVQLDGLRLRAEIDPVDGAPTLSARLPEAACMSVIGMPGCLIADEARFHPQVQGGVAATGLTQLTGFELTARNCASLTITDETTETEIAPACTADTNGDNTVDVTDLVQVITDWGVCAGPCPADTNDDGVVDVTDLVQVITDWGDC